MGKILAVQARVQPSPNQEPRHFLQRLEVSMLPQPLHRLQLLIPLLIRQLEQAEA